MKKRKFIIDVAFDLMAANSITEVNQIKTTNVGLFDKFPVLFRFALNAEQRIRRIRNEKYLSWKTNLN